MLGIDGTFLAKLSPRRLSARAGRISELEEKKEFIFRVLTEEEEKFNKTIDQGLAILEQMEQEMVASGSKVLSGRIPSGSMTLYGFPVDLTGEILEEKGFSYDEAGFYRMHGGAAPQGEGCAQDHQLHGR